MEIIQRLNILDFVIITILLLTFLRGIFIGFVRAICTLVGLIMAFVISLHYHGTLSQVVFYSISDGLVRTMLSSILIFFTVYLLFWLVGIILHRFLRIIGLGWLNSLLGGVIGVSKGIILSAILLFSMTLILSPRTPLLNNSYLYPLIGEISRTFLVISKDETREKFLSRWNYITKRRTEGRNGKPIK